eukprot:scaffold731_cov261-Pinguiococcus_pyrenoidosus.AAC.56
MACDRFFILSPRGDTIISKQYRGEVRSALLPEFRRTRRLSFNVCALSQVTPGAAEAFFRTVKFWEVRTGLCMSVSRRRTSRRSAGWRCATSCGVGRGKLSLREEERPDLRLCHQVQRVAKLVLGAAGASHEGLQRLLRRLDGRRDTQELHPHLRTAGRGEAVRQWRFADALRAKTLSGLRRSSPISPMLLISLERCWTTDTRKGQARSCFETTSTTSRSLWKALA